MSRMRTCSVYTRVHASVSVACKIEPQLGYFNIPFSWTVQTMNLYDRVSISRPNYVERIKKIFFHVFTSDPKN